MYALNKFQIHNTETIFQFLEDHSFGQLISTVDGEPFASHIPFLIERDKKLLLGHMAKSNPQWKSLEQQKILVTFNGPHDYISPSVYSQPGVPTWNYQVVHVKGSCNLTESDELIETITKLTQKYEEKRENKWQVDYPEKLVNAIVGFKIKIEKIECSFKLSQNRKTDEINNIIIDLQARGNTALAEAMKTHAY